jgi:hypothetical protein
MCFWGRLSSTTGNRRFLDERYRPAAQKERSIVQHALSDDSAAYRRDSSPPPRTITASGLPQRGDGTCDRTDVPAGHSLTPPLVSRAMTDAPQNDPAMPKMKQYAPIASLPTSRLTQYPDPRPTAMANTINNRSPASNS